MQHLLLSIFLSFAIGVIEAFSPIEKGDAPVIIIIQSDGDETVGNRGPVSIPISGYVDSSTGLVYISFDYPCGTVQISFDNLTNGDYFNTEINGTGTVMIPAILSPGTWKVVFSLPNGDRFIGDFFI
jgi:Protein of unknown function (DUF3244).